MKILLLLAVAAGVAALVLRVFLTTPPADLARRLRLGAGVLLILAAIGLAFLRRFPLAIPLALAGLFVLRRHAGMGRMSPAAPPASNVRSAGLDMTLDHETGEMDGKILAGRHEGKMLSELDFAALKEVGDDFRGDADSLRLLEGYLDRRHPGWRDDVETDAARGQSAPAGAGRMSLEEAYEILGLDAGAGEAEVREAHRRLMKQLHPDRGGTSALAAKINEAKDRIVGRHR